MSIQNKLLEKMPQHLYKFLDTLSSNELHEIEKLDPRLIAKVYQAGAVFAIEATVEISKEVES